jgi:membrane protein
MASPRSDRMAPDDPTDLSSSSWRGVLRRSLKEFKNDNLSDWAAALTYRGVLALAPALLVLVSGLGLLGESTTQRLVDNVGSLAPGGVRNFIQTLIDNVQNNRTAGITALVGVLVALWSASGYIAAFMRASNAIYDIGEGRPVWKTIPTRLAVTVAVVVLSLVGAAIVVFTGPIAEQMGKAIGVGHTAVVVWGIVKWPILVVLVSLMLSILYYACPNVKQPGFQWVSPGGGLAVLIWLAASAGFGIYVANFGSYNKTYGSLASVIIFLIWFWITNLAILLGAEFNAELQHSRAILAGESPDQETFAEPRDTRKLNQDKQEQSEALETR